MFLVVMPCNERCNKSFSDVQVAPRNSLRQSSKPVFLEKLGKKATQKQITFWSIPHPFPQPQRSSRAWPLLLTLCLQINSVASNSRTRQLVPNYTQLLLENHRYCEWHVPTHGYHTYGDMQLPTWPTFSVIIRVGAIVLYHFENSKSPSRFTVQKPMV